MKAAIATHANPPTEYKLRRARTMRFALLALAAAAGTLAAPLSAEAGGKRCWENDNGDVVCRHRSRSYDRRSADEREYDRARANDVDPTGSYKDYPDWARYALSPKGQR